MPQQGPDNRSDASSPAPTFHPRRSRDRPATERLAVDIAEAAQIIGVSYNTLWRAIRDGQFPGVKIRDRILVPRKAIEMLFDTACATGELVDAAPWTAEWTRTFTTATDPD